MTVNPETAQWLDGPSLVAWLEDEGYVLTEPRIGPSAIRRVYQWRQGGAASVWTVDRILTPRFGPYLLREIPAHIWRDGSSKGGLTSECRRAEIRDRARAGEPLRVIARELGHDPKTVRKYARAA